MNTISTGQFLHKAQQLGETSVEFWIAKLLVSSFENAEFVGKPAKVEIFTISEKNKHSVFASVRFPPEDGKELFLGMAHTPVNSDAILYVWL